MEPLVLLVGITLAVSVTSGQTWRSRVLSCSHSDCLCDSNGTELRMHCHCKRQQSVILGQESVVTNLTTTDGTRNKDASVSVSDCRRLTLEDGYTDTGVRRLKLTFSNIGLVSRRSRAAESFRILIFRPTNTLRIFNSTIMNFDSSVVGDQYYTEVDLSQVRIGVIHAGTFNHTRIRNFRLDRCQVGRVASNAFYGAPRRQMKLKGVFRITNSTIGTWEPNVIDNFAEVIINGSQFGTITANGVAVNATRATSLQISATTIEELRFTGISASPMTRVVMTGNTWVQLASGGFHGLCTNDLTFTGNTVRSAQRGSLHFGTPECISRAPHLRTPSGNNVHTITGNRVLCTCDNAQWLAEAVAEFSSVTRLARYDYERFINSSACAGDGVDPAQQGGFFGPLTLRQFMSVLDEQVCQMASQTDQTEDRGPAWWYRLSFTTRLAILIVCVSFLVVLTAFIAICVIRRRHARQMQGTHRRQDRRDEHPSLRFSINRAPRPVSTHDNLRMNLARRLNLSLSVFQRHHHVETAGGHDERNNLNNTDGGNAKGSAPNKDIGTAGRWKERLAYKMNDLDAPVPKPRTLPRQKNDAKP